LGVKITGNKLKPGIVFTGFGLGGIEVFINSVNKDMQATALTGGNGVAAESISDPGINLIGFFNIGEGGAINVCVDGI
jgi:hypothetical protein